MTRKSNFAFISPREAFPAMTAKTAHGSWDRQTMARMTAVTTTIRTVLAIQKVDSG